MITPAIVPAFDLDPDSAELVSFEEVVSEMPLVVDDGRAEEEVEEERPALLVVVGDVELDAVLRTGANERVVELDVERVDEEDSVVLVSSSSSVEEAVVDARAVVRRVVLLEVSEDSTELLIAEPRPGARVGVSSSSSLAVDSGWPADIEESVGKGETRVSYK